MEELNRGSSPSSTLLQSSLSATSSPSSINESLPQIAPMAENQNVSSWRAAMLKHIEGNRNNLQMQPTPEANHQLSKPLLRHVKLVSLEEVNSWKMQPQKHPNPEATHQFSKLVWHRVSLEKANSLKFGGAVDRSIFRYKPRVAPPKHVVERIRKLGYDLTAENAAKPDQSKAL